MDRKEIERLYTSQGFDYRPTTADLTEADFFDRVTDKPIRRRLDKVVRIKVGGGGSEFIVYNETLITQDKLGNIRSLPRSSLGRYDKPQFTYQWDKDLRKEVATSLVGKKTVYEIPYSKENMQKIYDLNTEPDATTTFVLVTGANARYSGFTADEFLNRSYDELFAKATTGEYPIAEPEPAVAEPRDPRIRDRRGLKEMKEIKKGLVAETEPGSKEEEEYAKMSERIEELSKGEPQQQPEQPQVVVKEVEGEPDEELKGLKKPSRKSSKKQQKM